MMVSGRSLLACALLMLPAASSWAQAPGSAEWNRIQNESARDRVQLDALQRHHGGGAGGCTPLPGGWAALEVTVNFPAAYGGYPAWVNSAELLPVGNDLRGFVGGKNVPGALVRSAGHHGMTVTSSMCAPAGRAYWVVVDSGRQRVAVGQVKLGAGSGPFRVTMMAPPLRR